MLEIRTVLCPVDFTPLSERGLDLALQLCRRCGARLVLEHNLDPGPPSYLTVNWMWTGEHRREAGGGENDARERLEGLLARVPATIPREARLTRGPVDEALLILARQLPADLVVMGTHGWSNPEHRSLTEQLITASPCPVLTTTEGCGAGAGLCRTGGEEPLQVVVPVDFSLRSRAALDYSWALAESWPARLHLVHVAPSGGDDPGLLDRRLRGLIPEAHRGHSAHRVLSGDVAGQLAAVGREVGADVMIIGVRSKGWLQRLTSGVTAFEMLHDPTCPVWFVPVGGRAGLARPEAGAAVPA